MKKLFFPMLALLTISMASCTNENEPNVEVDGLVPVQLSAGIGEITTKAAINPKDAFEAQIYATTAKGVYINESSFNDGTVNVAETSGQISFNTAQYYPVNGNSIFMKGFAPQNTTIADGIISYIITGAEDIMVTNEIEGSKTDAADKTLAFNHLLTQLKIKVVADDAGTADAWGKVTSIKIKKVPTALDLNLSAGTIATNANPLNEDLSVLTAPIAIPDNESGASDAGTIMLLPSNDAFTILIETENGGEAKEVKVSQVITEPSKAYEITVTFKRTQVETKASVGVWTPVSGGTATVQ